MFQKKSRAAQILSLGLVGILLFSNVSRTSAAGAADGGNGTSYSKLGVQMNAESILLKKYLDSIKQDDKTKNAIVAFSNLFSVTQSTNAVTHSSGMLGAIRDKYFSRTDDNDGTNMARGLYALTEAISQTFRKTGGSQTVLSYSQFNTLRELYKYLFDEKNLRWLFGIKRENKTAFKNKKICFQSLSQLMNLSGNMRIPHTQNLFTKYIELHVFDKLTQNKSLTKDTLIEISLNLVYASIQYDLGNKKNDIEDSLKDCARFCCCLSSRLRLFGDKWPMPSAERFTKAFIHLAKWTPNIDRTKWAQEKESKRSLFQKLSGKPISKDEEKRVGSDFNKKTRSEEMIAMMKINLVDVRSRRRRLMQRLLAGCPPKRS